ncbi:thioesterase II family protein [Actinomadura formosensis]|uniref:thioesterase II family protein n=1 Tax=Actinomadura formosensis TaxID=60706 RepID=UPI003D8EEEA9
MAAVRNRWFAREPKPNSHAYVFCLPYSGCGASMYRQWPEVMHGVEMCAVQPPGRENRLREPAFDTYEELAEALIPQLLPYLDRPFAFFGHCASSLVGYEVTVQLLGRGLPLPTRLFVSSQVAPHQGPHGRFLDMTDEQLADELSLLITEMGGNPRPDIIDVAMGTLLADIAANRRYKPAEPTVLPVPITALSWREDKEVPGALMGGWSECGEVAFRELEGGHYRFISAPETLKDELRRGMGAVV